MSVIVGTWKIAGIVTAVLAFIWLLIAGIVQMVISTAPPQEEVPQEEKPPREPKPPKEPKPAREPKPPKEPKPPREPKTPKEPKPPRELKPPKAQKPPRKPGKARNKPIVPTMKIVAVRQENPELMAAMEAMLEDSASLPSGWDGYQVESRCLKLRKENGNES